MVAEGTNETLAPAGQPQLEFLSLVKIKKNNKR